VGCRGLRVTRNAKAALRIPNLNLEALLEFAQFFEMDRRREINFSEDFFCACQLYYWVLKVRSIKFKD
jgi:hypothetical protein